MPTFNRRAFVPFAIEYFLRQEYPNRELIILDDGSDAVEDLVPDHELIRYHRLPKKITLGAKMNLACSYAAGELILNWDDDDWYAPWRLAYQQQAMHPGVAVSGINQLLYYDIDAGKGYQYRYPEGHKPWLLGSSLCFTREAWRRTPFADINVGMDGLFVWGLEPGQVRVLENQRFSVHMIHGRNVSPKNTSGLLWESFPVPELRAIIGADWPKYLNDGVAPTRQAQRTSSLRPLNSAFRPLRNVFACLVHEEPECVTDLVRNLQHHEPDAAVLLYNGSGDPRFLDDWTGHEQQGVYVHPAPSPQQHGYLHGFALDCMRYALEVLSFDLLTIVDSDQLCLRSGFTDYLSRFLADKPRTGLLSSNAVPILPGERENLVAAQLFDEWDLWQPLLEQLSVSDALSVQWTFWPGTVFTKQSCADLCRLFGTSRKLRFIMKKTQIWATEEVILPTLVKYLGYDVIDNPCCNDLVQYRQAYSSRDLRRAAARSDQFWMHPVPRQLNDPLRLAIREAAGGYAFMPRNGGTTPRQPLHASRLLATVRAIPGWLSDAEGRLLIDTVVTACAGRSGTFRVVETGCYQGKSTVLLGTALQAQAEGDWSITSIDMHDGCLGDAEQGLQQFPPSYDAYCSRLRSAGLSDRVTVVRGRAQDIAWNLPISLLLIDGLHDYGNVSAEFRHFERWLEPEGIVAFHDYADYFPGVVRLADELLASGQYRKLQQAGSLLILSPK